MANTSAAIALFVACAASAACGGKAGLGEPCDVARDCELGAQCFAGRCVPTCQRGPECGDGYTCDEGACVGAVGELGQPCASEMACGQALSCHVTDAGSGAASCVVETAALPDGAACTSHAACRHGTCMFDRCVSLCAAEIDCRQGERCQESPYLVDRFAIASPGEPPPPLVAHCLADEPTLVFEVPVHNSPAAATWLPMPRGATSFTVATFVGSGKPLVGMAALTSPSGTADYEWPQTDAAYLAGARYAPTEAMSLFTWPRPSGQAIEAGAYRADLGVFTPARQRLAVPAVAKVVVRMLPLVSVDLALHVLDTTDHPCVSPFSAATINSGDEIMAQYLPALRAILQPAGIAVGRVTFYDLTDRGDLDEIAATDLAALHEAATAPGAINIYLVRSVTPAGLAVATAAIPTTSASTFTAAPVALSLAARCYLSWRDLARATARTLAIHAGMWPSLNLAGQADNFADTPQSSDNLMHPAEYGGTSLSTSQRYYLREHMVVP
ncbi:MAG: hypothetical protein IPL79_13875 [Myxococcales bacterium]|nr:hypothetical protein [Myxococcales bacterium]